MNVIRCVQSILLLGLCFLLLEVYMIHQTASRKIRNRKSTSLGDIQSILLDGLFDKRVNADLTLYNGERVTLSKRRHLILVWRHPQGNEKHGIPEGTVIDKCTFTYQRNTLSKASAVLFHYSALDDEDYPRYRHPDQVYVYQNIETPNYVLIGEGRTRMLAFDDDFINWTMTYKWNSDVFASYFDKPKFVRWLSDDHKWHFERSIDILRNGAAKVDKLLRKKSRLALWVVSNCQLTWGAIERKNYYDQLVKAGLGVDAYGDCFDNQQVFAKLPAAVLDSYKFYLAFENSLHCEDYITEKFWIMGIKAGRVPVVWGPSKQDVAKLTPPGSFIHADDFKSAAHLANYLSYLDLNDTAYREYFKWRSQPDWRTDDALLKHFMNNEELLCLKLQRSFNRQSYKSITDYYYGGEPKECLQPKYDWQR